MEQNSVSNKTFQHACNMSLLGNVKKKQKHKNKKTQRQKDEGLSGMILLWPCALFNSYVLPLQRRLNVTPRFQVGGGQPMRRKLPLSGPASKEVMRGRMHYRVQFIKCFQANPIYSGVC